MPISMNDRIEMLQIASKAWLELSRTLKSLTDAQLIRPNTIGAWSGKDVVAHIANWEELASDAIEQIDAGNSDAWQIDAWNEVVDEMNEELLDSWRDRSIADVRQYLEDAHFTLMNLAERSLSVQPAIVAEVTSEHYRQHADDFRLLANLPKR